MILKRLLKRIRKSPKPAKEIEGVDLIWFGPKLRSGDEHQRPKTETKVYDIRAMWKK